MIMYANHLTDDLSDVLCPLCKKGVVTACVKDGKEYAVVVDKEGAEWIFHDECIQSHIDTGAKLVLPPYPSHYIAHGKVTVPDTPEGI